ncbi:DsbA family protein [Methylobrevis albus]|uniref:DsbA family protein n=1 Tax=Methylobrevis albus TaxID=2793297 RepID=A0A931I0A8_9HYPH|nr:DsbA family protein [Methylobrevis albus]MBH0237992.1 DsbA family protein [Methylobrevis albus]
MNLDARYDRRRLLGAAALGLAALQFGAGGARAQDAQALVAKALGDPGPLPEQGFGPEDAKVRVVEYASLTCHHCRNFHLETWPLVKAKYVDTGRIRFVIREFPLDPLAMGGFMLARCRPDEQWYATVDLLYRSSEVWAHAADPAAELARVMGQTGMGAEAFEACLSDQALMDKIQAVSLSGSVAGVSGTPTFFFNERKESGFMTIEAFSAILDPMLEG